MVKKIITTMLLASFFTISYAIPWEVQIQGEPIRFEVEPRIIQGQIYVPLYDFYQELGLEVSFDHSSMTVTGEKKGLKIQTKIGSNTAYINGNPQKMKGIPVIISNRTMIPMNFVTQTFGYDVVVSKELKVFYLREFITAYKDKIDANSLEAEYNSVKSLPRVEVELVEMEGKKENYLNAGSSWTEIIYISEEKDVDLDEIKYEPTRFYTGNNLYAYFVLENTSDEDILTPFDVQFIVKQNNTKTIRVESLKKGEKFEIKNLSLPGLTHGNNIVEVYIDPEGVLNQKESKDYYYRIFYANSTR